MGCTFSYRLFQPLLAESLDPFAEVLLGVQIRFADARCFCHGIEVDSLLLTYEQCDRFIYTLPFFLFATMSMSDHSRGVTFPVFLTHGPPPVVAPLAVAATQEPCTPVHTSHFSPRSVPG